VDQLMLVALEHDMVDELGAFLNHYPQQTPIDE
jgi:hypothetical protein